jgi:hypothetical protein
MFTNNVDAYICFQSPWKFNRGSLNSEIPVFIWIRITDWYSLVCCKRRLNGGPSDEAGKPRTCITVSVAR